MSRVIHIQQYQSPVGELQIGTFNNKLVVCDWAYRKKRNSIYKKIQQWLNAEYQLNNSELGNETINQLEEYFNKKRKTFDIPLLFTGTPFQTTVWHKLLTIPYGKTISYSQLSKDLNAEKAIRAIASANGANAISIIVPCHRVIAKNGDLVGYAGGLTAKRKLLSLEFGEQQGELF